MFENTFGGRSKPSPAFFIQLFLFCFAVILTVTVSSSFEPPKRSEKMAVNAEILFHTSLGFNLLMADFLWLRVLQEIDYKDRTDGKISKGWVFQLLNGVITLDPRYKIAYVVGPQVVSILVGDIDGARILYEKAINQYPDDWQYWYKAGYHSLYEVKDCEKAAYYFHGAVTRGAPYWAADLAQRLYSKAGQVGIARSVYIDAIHKFKGTPQEDWLKKKLHDFDEQASKSDGPPLVCKPPKS